MCLVVLLGLVVPRCTLVLLYFFTDWTRVITACWLALLGFLILPYTTLAYVLIHHYSGIVSTERMGHVILMLAALVADVGSWGATKNKAAKSRKR